jgi:hypothetical protein
VSRFHPPAAIVPLAVHDDAVSEDASCSTECGAVAGIYNFLDHESSIELDFLDPLDSEYLLANVTAGATYLQ